MESSMHGGVLAIGKTSLMSREGAEFTMCKKVERQRQDVEGGHPQCLNLSEEK